MTYSRVVGRNQLKDGGYDDKPNSMLRGDLRRLEQDTRDNNHLAFYSALTGVAPATIKLLFDVFFERNAFGYVPGFKFPDGFGAEYDRIRAELDAADNKNAGDGI